MNEELVKACRPVAAEVAANLSWLEHQLGGDGRIGAWKGFHYSQNRHFIREGWTNTQECLYVLNDSATVRLGNFRPADGAKADCVPGPNRIVSRDPIAASLDELSNLAGDHGDGPWHYERQFNQSESITTSSASEIALAAAQDFELSMGYKSELTGVEANASVKTHFEEAYKNSSSQSVTAGDEDKLTMVKDVAPGACYFIDRDLEKTVQERDLTFTAEVEFSIELWAGGYFTLYWASRQEWVSFVTGVYSGNARKGGGTAKVEDWWMQKYREKPANKHGIKIVTKPIVHKVVRKQTFDHSKASNYRLRDMDPISAARAFHKVYGLSPEDYSRAISTG